jgi:glutamate carboxypeptidase
MGFESLSEAHAWLEASQERMVNDLVELANQNSGSDNTKGLIAVADWLSDWIGLHPATLSRIALPPRRITGNDAKELVIETGPALRWDYFPECRRRILLAIHYDTVYGADNPFQQCHRLDSDKLRGPGVADAKGGIIVLRYALQAILKFSLAKECGWTVLLTPDEEVGSPSSASLMRDMAQEFDFALLFEPCLPGGEFVSKRKGSGNFVLVLRGRSAHAGRDFQQGRNAVVKLCTLLAEIDKLNGARDGMTINIGNVIGGGPTNVVPDLAVARVNVRVNDNASADWFEKELKSLVSVIQASEGFQCEVHGGVTSPAKLINDEMRQLMSAIETCAGQLGQSVHWQETGGVCDGNKLAAAGLPNIDTLGPLGDCLHSPQEWVQVSSIVAKSKLIAELISRFSSGRLESLERSKFNDEIADSTY